MTKLCHPSLFGGSVTLFIVRKKQQSEGNEEGEIKDGETRVEQIKTKGPRMEDVGRDVITEGIRKKQKKTRLW